MKEESIFKKVFIKSENDLPKVKGRYAVGIKGTPFHPLYLNANDFDPDVDLTKAKCNAVASKKYWLETFDWYLQPLDEKEYLKDELIKFCNTFNMNNTSEKIVNEYLNNK
jgi:hypothetical protein